MPQIFCILEEGGRALLTRAQGDIQTPNFPTVGLLSSIATYTENSGHELRAIGSTNVRIIYRRFINHLLFVLVTSNLLLQTELLHLHLRTVYDALVLLLGRAALQLDTTIKVDLLKKKLRGVQRAVDSLIADDTLVPCILLPIPQVVGLPLRDKATLQACLQRCVGMLGCTHAALVGEGYYMAATHGWWALLTPREQLLVQHLAMQLQAQQQEQGATGAAGPEALLHVAKRHFEAPLRLRTLLLREGVLLLALYESTGPAPPPLQEHEHQLAGAMQAAAYTLETPVWLRQPVPQFASLTFDLALVVERQPPSVTLLWGHTGTAMQQGFNPLMSPTLRKQLGTSPSPIGPRLYKSPSVYRDDVAAAAAAAGAAGGAAGGGGDGVQLLFRSTADTLVSFIMQSWPQLPPALQAVLHDRGAAAAATAAASQLQQQRQQEQQQEAPALRRVGSAAHPLPSPASALQPQGRAAAHGPRSRLGLGAPARRRASMSAPNSPAATPAMSFSRLHSLFGRKSGDRDAAGGAAGAEGPGGGEGTAAPVGGEQPGGAAYEEIHAVLEGARLLALLDHSPSTASAISSPAGGEGGAADGGSGGVDVFVAFPKRVGRAAALDTALTLRATYLMAYHDVE